VFPDEPGLLGDRRNTLHTVDLLAQTDTLFPLAYRGGLKLEFEQEEKLFRSSVSDTLVSDTTYRGTLRDGLPSVDTIVTTNRDSLVKVNQDYQATAAVMEHELRLPMPNGMALWYSYQVSRRSVTYTNPRRIDSLLNDGDYDRQRQLHEAGFCGVDNERWTADLVLRYSRQVLNFVKATRSGQNSTDRTWLVQARLAYHRDSSLQVGEVLSAEANASEWQYPGVHQGPDGAPPFRRSFTSMLTGTWWITGGVGLRAAWQEAYWDQGRWYGSEYFSTVSGADTLRLDYYAIERKSTQYKVLLALLGRPVEGVSVELGGSFGDIYDRTFVRRTGSYRDLEPGNSYMVQPYLRFDWRMARHLRVAASIERYLDLYHDSARPGGWYEHWYWGADAYWDARLTVSWRL
jgi:hypothetical protein